MNQEIYEAFKRIMRFIVVEIEDSRLDIDKRKVEAWVDREYEQPQLKEVTKLKKNEQRMLISTPKKCWKCIKVSQFNLVGLVAP